jgi:hypothetical protein
MTTYSEILMAKNTQPAHPWLCQKCRFLMQAKVRKAGDAEPRVHDVYESCSAMPGRTEYLIVHSARPGDYTSSITLEHLFIDFCIRR